MPTPAGGPAPLDIGAARPVGSSARYLGQVLGEAAVAAGRTNTFLGDRYRRLARRRGGARATVAVGRSILVIIWHLLADPDARYRDLGSDYIRHRTDPRRRTQLTSANSKRSATPSP